MYRQQHTQTYYEKYSVYHEIGSSLILDKPALSQKPTLNQQIVQGRVSQQFRVIGVKQCLSKNNEPYTRLDLGCSAGSIIAIAWHKKFRPSSLAINHGDVLQFSGNYKIFTRGCFTNIDRIEWVDPAQIEPQALFPSEWVPDYAREALNSLVSHIDAINDRHLKQFLIDVFLVTTNTLGFLNVPASKYYHHAYYGGVLVHSNEMLSILETVALRPLSEQDYDLVKVITIIHDLGKIVTMAGRDHSDRGLKQPHDMAILEIITEAIKRLELKDPTSADIIRGYFRCKRWFPVYKNKVHETVSQLDRLSVNADHEKRTILVNSSHKKVKQ